MLSFEQKVEIMYNRIEDPTQEGGGLQHHLRSVLIRIQFGMHPRSSIETYMWLVKPIKKNPPTPQELVNACDNHYHGGPFKWTYATKAHSMVKRWPETCVLFTDRYNDEYIMQIITIYVMAKRRLDYAVMKRAHYWLTE